jgi:hypothetical protein
MTLPGLVAANNLSDVVDRERAWDNLGTDVSAEVPILFPNVLAAYSLRLLNANISSVIRVRRSSDNSEQDFSAVQILNGHLTSFCGTGDGFVTTWYDQSGNGHHQSRAAQNQQPSIVLGGIVNTLNGRPCVVLDNRLGLGSSLNIGPNWMIFMAARNTKLGGRLLSSDAGNIATMTFDRGNESYYFRGLNNAPLSVYANSTVVPGANLALGTFCKSSTNAFAFVNSALVGSASNLGANELRSWAGFAIGAGSSTSTETPNANYFEIIVYSTEDFFSRPYIENAINSYYLIY